MRNIITISKLLNPAVLFSFIWTITIILYSLNLTEYIEKSSLLSLSYLLFSVLVIIIFGIPLKYRKVKFDLNSLELNNLNVTIVSIIFLPLLILEVISEITYFGTLPFLSSYFIAGDFDYNMAGEIFKFKHNIFVKANSIFLSGFFFFIYHFVKKKKIFFICYLLPIVISLLYISRSTLISIASISFIIYLIRYPINIKFYIYTFIFLIIASYIFDKLYFLRNIEDKNFYLNTHVDYGFIDSVVRGIEGLYIYIASPISNLLHNIDKGTFNYLDFRPSYLIRSFLPADLANLFFGPIDFNNKVYLPNNSNTFTTFPAIFFAFGLYGSILFFFTFLGLLMRYLHYKTISNPYKWLLILVFLNHIVMFSIFSSSFFNIVYYFPLLIAFIFPPLKKIKTV